MTYDQHRNHRYLRPSPPDLTTTRPGNFNLAFRSNFEDFQQYKLLEHGKQIPCFTLLPFTSHSPLINVLFLYIAFHFKLLIIGLLLSLVSVLNHYFLHFVSLETVNSIYNYFASYNRSTPPCCIIIATVSCWETCLQVWLFSVATTQYLTTSTYTFRILQQTKIHDCTPFQTALLPTTLHRTAK